MIERDLYRTILGVEPPWHVVSVDIDKRPWHPEAPTFQIETLRGQDGSPLAGCEVLVLQDAMDESDENIALFLQHGLQLAERLEAKGVRYRTGESGRLESRHGLRDILRQRVIAQNGIGEIANPAGMLHQLLEIRD